jgi:uncharacterized membrane protein
MLPEPLHPAVVHFPVVLAVLMPIVAVVTLVAIRRGARPTRAWAIMVAMAAALTLSAWLALRTGEAEEERVEAVVAESVLHEHEEAAERFMTLSAIVLVAAGLGLFGGAVGKVARGVAAAGTVAILVAGIRVGAAGGALVYEHGAAQAYTDAQTPPSGEASAEDSDRADRTRE